MEPSPVGVQSPGEPVPWLSACTLLSVPERLQGLEWGGVSLLVKWFSLRAGLSGRSGCLAEFQNGSCVPGLFSDIHCERLPGGAPWGQSFCEFYPRFPQQSQAHCGSPGRDGCFLSSLFLRPHALMQAVPVWPAVTAGEFRKGCWVPLPGTSHPGLSGSVLPWAFAEHLL